MEEAKTGTSSGVRAEEGVAEASLPVVGPPEEVVVVAADQGGSPRPCQRPREEEVVAAAGQEGSRRPCQRPLEEEEAEVAARQEGYRLPKQVG